MPEQSESQLKEFNESQLKERNISRLNPPHCRSIIVELDALTFGGFPPVLSGDFGTASISDASSGDDISFFSNLLFNYGLGAVADIPGGGWAGCANALSVRYRGYKIEYSGKVWGIAEGEEDAALHDFAYMHRVAVADHPISAGNNFSLEEATNNDGGHYLAVYDDDTGITTETGGILGDVLYTAPGLGESGNDVFGAVAAGGTATITISAASGDPAPNNIIEMVVNVPADYHEIGSPAYSRTLTVTMTDPWTRGEFLTNSQALLDLAHLDDLNYVYSASNANPDIDSSAGSMVYQKKVWGGHYKIHWSGPSENNWPNRPIISRYNPSSFIGAGSPSGGFYTVEARQIETYDGFEATRVRVGVLDRCCFKSVEYSSGEVIAGGSTVQDVCNIDLGGDPTGENFCSPDVLPPGDYIIGIGIFANGTVEVVRNVLAYEEDGLRASDSEHICYDWTEDIDELADPNIPTSYDCCW